MPAAPTSAAIIRRRICLHEALRQVLGDHVAQKGSLVAPDRLRFDFSHPKPMTAEELEKVEDIANDYVLQNSAVTTRLMAIEDARASGARALFGEKYGDEVRVVAMGEGGGNTLGWSVELCGGTHVRRTGDIGIISGLTDSGVAAGVRRLEALTGTAARKSLNHVTALAKNAAAEIKAPLDEMPARLAALLDERRKLERELTDAKKKLAMGGGAKAGNGARWRADGRRRQADGARGLGHRHQGPEKPCRRGQEAARLGRGRARRRCRGWQGQRRGRRHPAILTARFSAVDLVRKGGEVLGGKGGGGGPTWRRPAGPTARRPMRRSPRSSCYRRIMPEMFVSPPLRGCIARRRAACLHARHLRCARHRSALRRAEGNRSRFRDAAEDGTCFIVEADGRLIGCIFCAKDGDALYIGRLAVAPEWRRRGVATG